MLEFMEVEVVMFLLEIWARIVFTAVEAMINCSAVMARINEVMASGANASEDSRNQVADWIELKNAGTQAVSLGGMYLTDDMRHARKWKFPEDTTIAPGGFLLVWADGSNKADDSLHANFKLSKEGEALASVSNASFSSPTPSPS